MNIAGWTRSPLTSVGRTLNIPQYSGASPQRTLWDLKTVCCTEVSTIQRLFYMHIQGGHQRKNERGWQLRKPVGG